MTPPETTLPTGQAVADLLVEAGVSRVYTVPGESFLPLLEAFHRHPDLRVISTRHESGAAFMADADAKLTGRPAVVLATRGVGASNLAIGLHTARQDCTPVLALIGQVETNHLGNEAFQEVDLPSFVREVSTWAVTAHRGDRVAQLVARALARATGARPGPAVVALPSDLLEGRCAPQHPLVDVRPSSAGREAVLDIAGLLARAERPAVIAGQGCGQARLGELADVYGLAVYSAFRRQDCFPNDDEHYVGHLALGATPQICSTLVEADVVLVLGERLDETTTQGYTLPEAGSTVIHVHPDPGVLGSHQYADVAVATDVARVCEDLLGVAGAVDADGGNGHWLAGHRAYLEQAASSAAAGPGAGLHPGMAIAAVQRAARAETVVVNDAGNFSVYLHRQWVFNQPGTQAAPVSGAMGYAVPAAVGAALARPELDVLGVAGDGGFLMTAVELETAVREALPVKLLVLQNGLYGTIAMHQARSGLPVTGCDISDVDIAGLARALGAQAWQVEREGQLADAAAALISHRGPAVMVVRTDPDVIAPGRSLRLMKGSSP